MKIGARTRLAPPDASANAKRPPGSRSSARARVWVRLAIRKRLRGIISGAAKVAMVFWVRRALRHAPLTRKRAGHPTGVASLAGAKQRFSRNAIWNLLGFLTQIGCAFVVVPILVHGLGGVQYGIWTLIGQTITGMNLLDFGLSIGVGRFFARHHAQDDREEISRLLSTGLAVSIIPAALMLLGGAALAIWAPRFFHFPPALDLQVRVAIMLV